MSLPRHHWYLVTADPPHLSLLSGWLPLHSWFCEKRDDRLWWKSMKITVFWIVTSCSLVGGD